MCKYFILLFLISITSCKQSKSLDAKNNDEKVVITNDYVEETRINKEKEFQEIKKQEHSNLPSKSIKIIGNLEKIIDQKNGTEELEETGCSGWNITSIDVQNIFKEMKQVNSNEWNSYCYHYPCSYKGVAIYEGSEYNIFVNAASYVILENEGNKMYFILEEKDDIFLQACSCCEDG